MVLNAAEVKSAPPHGVVSLCRPDGFQLGDKP